jgi:hypothetical protein
MAPAPEPIRPKVEIPPSAEALRATAEVPTNGDSTGKREKPDAPVRYRTDERSLLFNLYQYYKEQLQAARRGAKYQPRTPRL